MRAILIRLESIHNAQDRIWATTARLVELRSERAALLAAPRLDTEAVIRLGKRIDRLEQELLRDQKRIEKWQRRVRMSYGTRLSTFSSREISVH